MQTYEREEIDEGTLFQSWRLKWEAIDPVLVGDPIVTAHVGEVELGLFLKQGNLGVSLACRQYWTIRKTWKAIVIMPYAVTF